MGEGEYTVRTSKVITGAAPVPVVGADPRRVMVIFSTGIGPGGTSMMPTGWGDTAPLIPIPSDGRLEFLYSKHGPLVAGPWSVTGGAGGQDVYCTELLVIAR